MAYDDIFVALRERMAQVDVSSNSGYVCAREVSSSSAMGVLARCAIARAFVEEMDDVGDGFWGESKTADVAEGGVGRTLNFCVCGLRLDAELVSGIVTGIVSRLFADKQRRSSCMPWEVSLLFFRLSSDFFCRASWPWPVAVVSAKRHCAVMCGIVNQEKCERPKFN